MSMSLVLSHIRTPDATIVFILLFAESVSARAPASLLRRFLVTRTRPLTSPTTGSGTPPRMRLS
jgi:hypothetical protein